MFLQRPPDGRSFLAEIPDGKEGISASLFVMSKIVRHYKKDPSIRDKALEIVARVPGKSYAAEAEAIRSWVKENIRYTRDICDVETVQTPDVTLYNGVGDCDDQATLVATLLESIGHPTRFRAIGFSLGEYDHVFAETKIGPRWISVETTEEVPIGWNPPGIVSSIYSHN